MIQTKDVTVKMLECEAEKLEAYTKTDSKIDLLKGELTYKIKTVSGKSWRLIHDGTTAFAVIEGTEKDKTETIYDVIEFKTELDALAGIEKLGLIYTEGGPT